LLTTFLKRLQILKHEWQEKPSWDQANRRQKHGLVWGIRKKISQIIKDYFYLPFFLLIILWLKRTNFRKHPCLFDGRSSHVDTAVPSLGRGGVGIGSWFLALFFLAPAHEYLKYSNRRDMLCLIF
jgi:hypothetical protein